MAVRETDLDSRGSRRLSAAEQWVWTLIAAVTYITAGIFEKFFLNWFVGPLWLIGTLVFGPALWDRVRGRRRSRP